MPIELTDTETTVIPVHRYLALEKFHLFETLSS